MRVNFWQMFYDPMETARKEAKGERLFRLNHYTTFLYFFDNDDTVMKL